MLAAGHTTCAVSADIERMRESLLRRAEARLQRLQEEVEQGEQQLHAVLADFEAQARKEEAFVRTTLESRRVARGVAADAAVAGQARCAEDEIEARSVLSEALLTPRDIGPGWKR